MADVRRVRGGETGERGQLFLVTALALAVAFVGLALLLNTAIYTENLATRNSDPGTAAAVDYRGAVRGGVGGLVEAVNREDADYETLEANLSRGVANWSDTAAVHGAMRGRSTNVSLDGTENGTRIGQADAGRNFTNRSGATDWQLASDTAGVRAFEMNVSRSNLSDPVLADLTDLDDVDIYRVNVTADAGTWSVYVYQNSTAEEVRVAVENETGAFHGPCAASPGPDDHVVVDLTGAAVGGADCAPLSFFAALSDDADVAYRDADDVTGTYELVVASDFATVNGTGNYVDPGNGSPYATEAIYAANATLTYESAEVYYRSKLRVAPGEPS